MGSTLSVIASFAILRSTINDFVPPQLRNYLWSLSRRFSSELVMVIEESHKGSSNHLFNAAVMYLGGHVLFGSCASPQRLTVGKNENIRTLTFGLDRNCEILDTFLGVPMRWKYSSDYNSTLQLETRWYELCFRKEHLEMVKNRYLPHVIDVAKRIQDQSRVVKFYTVRRDRWCSNAVNLDHPMTFDTLAMDGELKQEVLEDLDSFINGKQYYKKIGKVWKRGYLLYGPPGTGKSSLIAAMANYLNFDIYNLNLSAVNSDSTLEYLLLHVSNRSILVLEDIDCSVNLHNREAGEKQNKCPSYQVTLSGLLNAVDGLLSCCGDGRIIVFTTNYRDRIDPALLRAGRMDRHICLSYCTFSTFKQLAANYLNISDHHLFSCIENLIKEVEVSPAEVAGELMKIKDPKNSLEALIAFLESKGSNSSITPPPTSDVDEKMTEEDSNNPEKENESQVKPCAAATNTANEDFSNHEEKLRKLCSASTKVGQYTIKAEMAPILSAVLLKHGDIAANSSLHSLQCRSSFLEILCGIIQKLQVTEFKNLKQANVKSMLVEIHDLESVQLEVSWLHKRLDEITEAMQLMQYSSNLKEGRSRKVNDIEKMEKELEGCKTETLELQKQPLQIKDKLADLKTTSEKLSETISSIEEKLSCFYYRSLVDGLV